MVADLHRPGLDQRSQRGRVRRPLRGVGTVGAESQVGAGPARELHVRRDRRRVVAVVDRQRDSPRTRRPGGDHHRRPGVRHGRRDRRRGRDSARRWCEWCPGRARGQRVGAARHHRRQPQAPQTHQLAPRQPHSHLPLRSALTAEHTTYRRALLVPAQACAGSGSAFCTAGTQLMCGSCVRQASSPVRCLVRAADGAQRP